MKISVVIPTFNRSNFIGRAIQSVLKQSYQASEVIIIDDGSTDFTDNVLRQYSKNIVVIKQDHRGVSCARNKGIERATGRWISFLDSDDEWVPSKLFQQVSALQKNPDFRISHTDEIWIRNGKRINQMKKHTKPHGWIYEECLTRCCISPSSILVQKSLLDEIGNFDESLPVCEDYDLWLRICCVYPIFLVPYKLTIKYGGHSDQLSKSYWGMDRFRIISLIKMLKNPLIDIEKRRQTHSMLLTKLLIIINGFIKRKNYKEAQYFQMLFNNWENLND